MKRSLRIFWSLIFVFSVLLGGTGLYAHAVEREKPSVLFLSSYSLNFDTVPLQLAGIQEALPADEFTLDTEFMDTKRFSSEEDLRLFSEMLQNKLQKLPKYDTVILGDDAALTFALNHRQKLFAGIPMVFLGINNLSLAQLAGNDPSITGIVEQVDFSANMDLIQSLFPGTTTIVAVSDDTLTGQGDQAQFAACAKQYPDLAFRLIDASKCSKAQLKEEISAVGSGSVLLYLTFFEDADGNAYTIDSGAALLASCADVPIFRISYGGMGGGVLGGIQISFEKAGQMAGNMARSILSGTPPRQIPVLMHSPTFGCFDKNVLDRFGIQTSQLPEGSRILNQKLSFYAQNKTLTLVAGTIGLCMLAVIALQIASGRRKWRLLNQDYLTKLPNRMWITERLRANLNKKEPCALVMLDIDDFKRVNDTMGHETGDALLIQTADRMRRAVQKNGCAIARLGGDEFLGIMENGDRRELEEWCRQILALFDEPFLLLDRRVSMTASMGVACAPRDSDSADQLLAYADTAMYSVKNSGKNSCRFFDAELRQQLERESALTDLLQDAAENDGFVLAYQPIYRAGGGAPCGFEALLRLKNAQAQPNEFIPLAEQNRLMPRLGRFAVETAVRQMAAWRAQGLPPTVMCVNFSSTQLRDHEFPDYVRALLRQYEIAPEQLMLEVRESVYLRQSEEETDRFLRRLVEQGIRLALDNFGTGYSAVKYLSYAPFAMMKLDRSLLRDCRETEDFRMIAGVVHLAHSLGRRVAAQGVEDERQLEVLRSLHCDYVQGFLLGRPGTPEDAAALLEVLCKAAKPT